MHLEWLVPYQPGEIIVRASSKGMQPGELRLIRTGDGKVNAAPTNSSPATSPAVDDVDGLPSAN